MGFGSSTAHRYRSSRCCMPHSTMNSCTRIRKQTPGCPRRMKSGHRQRSRAQGAPGGRTVTVGQSTVPCGYVPRPAARGRGDACNDRCSNPWQRSTHEARILPRARPRWLPRGPSSGAGRLTDRPDPGPPPTGGARVFRLRRVASGPAHSCSATSGTCCSRVARYFTSSTTTWLQSPSPVLVTGR